MSEQLQWLATCGRPWAEQRAQAALEITSMFEAGEISSDEHQALMLDLVSMDKLAEEADDLEVKNYLVSAIMIGAKLA